MRQGFGVVRAAATCCAAAFLAMGVISCTSTSTTNELADDPADVTVPGPLPTAPVEGADDGLKAGANDLIDELDSLQDETDLCTFITGAAFEALLGDNFNTVGLVSSPAGLTQLIVKVDQTFAHLVVIAPPEVQPAMVTIDEMWSRLSVLDQSAPGAEEQVAAILAEPQVAAANQSLGVWAALNCAAPETAPA